MTSRRSALSRLSPSQRVAGIGFLVLALVLVAYAIRVGTPLRYGDEKEYVGIAQGIVDGQGYRLYGAESAYRPPAWPLLLAAFLAVGLPTWLLPVVPAILLVIAAAAAGVAAVRISGRPLGALAAPAVLLYPIDAYTATTLYPQALATAGLALLVLLATRAQDGAPLSVLACAAVGLLMAVEVLSVPTMALTALVVGAWILVRQKGNRVRFAAIGGAAAALPVLAWTAFNTFRFGTPVLISTSGGQNLLIGNNPSATGDSGVDVDIDRYLEAAVGMSEPDRDAYLRQSAIDWILSDPVAALRLYVAKTVNYFSPYNAPTTAVEGTDSTARIALVVLAFVVLIAATSVRFGLHRRLSVQPVEWLVVGLFVANGPFMALFFTRTRFRQPLDAILLIEAAIGVVLVVVWLLDRYRSRRARREPEEAA